MPGPQKIRSDNNQSSHSRNNERLAPRLHLPQCGLAHRFHRPELRISASQTFQNQFSAWIRCARDACIDVLSIMKFTEVSLASSGMLCEMPPHSAALYCAG
jgi:hypothetical protein